MGKIKLTKYSHGAGCGCKISPNVLDEILSGQQTGIHDVNLIVGNNTKDDAAVYAIDQENAIISTTDFFMPIVDDPFDFGAIAATNAISDIYAMGGQPIMAISILGWPMDTLPAEVAREVIAGAKSICRKAGISLAGGHSIDAPEPMFGLAVTGKGKIAHIKTNDKATPGSKLYLTKPIGIGILTTAQKRGMLSDVDLNVAKQTMITLNSIGHELGKLKGVSAITDVTGFGLLGHLIEICEASNVSAAIDFTSVPVLNNLALYLDKKCIPGGTNRNFDSFREKVSSISETQKTILCDPQTSGGLLIAVEPDAIAAVEKLFVDYNLQLSSFGEIIPKGQNIVDIH